MSFWKTLGKIGMAAAPIVAAPFTAGTSLSWLPAALGAGGAALGAASQGSAQNRDAKFSGQMDLEKLLMERDQQSQNMRISREQEGRASGTDAWRKLLASERILGNASGSSRPSLSPYSMAPRAASSSELQGASAMRDEVLARLTGGNQIPMPTERPLAVDPKLLDAGGGEKTAGWLGALLQSLGQMRQAQPGQGEVRTPPYNPAPVMSGGTYTRPGQRLEAVR